MNKRTAGNVFAIILGVVLGVVVLLVRTIWRSLGDRQAPSGETVGMGAQARQAFDDVRERSEDVLDDAKQRADDLMHRGQGEQTGEQMDFGFPVEPDIATGEETVVQGTGDTLAGLADQQHGALGGIPDEPGDEPSDRVDESDERVTFVSRDDSVQTPADFAYGSGVSDEGVEVTLENDTERGDDVPLDEGIPNLGEPGDLEVASGQGEDVVERVDDDVPEDFGQSEPTDSINHDERWVGDTATQADEIPGASRGLADDNEVSGEETDIEDTDETGDLGLYEDVEPSGAGGEVDLENDESPAFDESEMSVVESPDDPIAEDSGGPRDDEMTLGLRDSETVDPDLGDQAGMTGEYEVADDMNVLAQEPTNVVGNRVGSDEAILDPDEDARERYLTGDAAEPDIPSRGDAEHLGTTGDFDEAAETETIPAAPTGDEQGTGNETPDRQPYVTGNDADEASRADPDETEVEDVTPGNDRGAYSAAWSSAAGVVDEDTVQPKRASAPTDDGDDGESASTDEVTEPDDPGISPDVGGDDLGEAGVDVLTNEDDDVGEAVEDAGPSEEGTPATSRGRSESPVDTSAGFDVVRHDSTDRESAPPDMAGGDVDTSTDPDRPLTPGEAADQARGAGEQSRGSRMSRRERRQQSDRVPEGAVRGDESGSCPAEYPIKGNANSRIYHRPSDASYVDTRPAYCFATEADAERAGFRPPKGR